MEIFTDKMEVNIYTRKHLSGRIPPDQVTSNSLTKLVESEGKHIA